MDSPFIEISADNFRLGPTEIIPIEDFEYPENYPDCCQFHRNVFKAINDWFELFPNCCDQHRKVAGKPWFRKEMYASAPQKILQAVTYTMNFIQKNIDREDYLKRIKDYVEYVTFSFGHPPIGCGQYINHLNYFLKSCSSQLPADRVEKLSAHLNEENNTEGKTDINEVGGDLNLLFSTYQKWLKAFPFNVEHFTTFKKKLENQLPFLSRDINVNQFNGLAKSKLVSKDELLNYLNLLTKFLLGSIDTTELYTNGKITDIQKQRLELASEAHRLKQGNLINDYSKAEMKYITTIKKWLKNEKEYFKELDSLLGKELLPSVNIQIGDNSILQYQNDSRSSNQTICSNQNSQT